MELITSDVEALHLGFADLDALLVAAGIEGAVDFQATLGRCCADQLDHGKPIRQRPATPVLRDVAEQPVLDLVPLRCARRIVVDADREPGLIGKLLQLDLPEPHTRTIRAAAVRRDTQFSGLDSAVAPCVRASNGLTAR